MDLLPTEEQDEIVSTIRAQLERDFALSELERFDGASSVVDRDLWRRCAELGWFGLGLDERLGGVGYSLVEESLLFAEIGAHATPGPFLGTVIGSRLAALTGATELAAHILSGDKIVALAEPHDDAEATAAETVSGTFRITDHGDADLVLVVVGDSAALVDASVMLREPLPSLDLLVPTAIGTVSNVPTLLHLTNAAALRLRATVLVASELSGMAVATAEQSTQYAKDRHQFGVPIGSFQAVKHRCADMAVQAEAATTLTRYASLAVFEGHTDAAFHALAARSVASRAAIDNSQTNVQNHGGIGFTWEHSAHRYVTRAQVRSRTLGTLRESLGHLVSLPAPAA